MAGKVNEFEIKITRAIITKISVELDFETNEPEWHVEGKLLTNTGKPISDFGFSNKTWYSEENKISVPPGANLLGRDLFVEFTPVILEKLGNMYKALPSPKE